MPASQVNSDGAIPAQLHAAVVNIGWHEDSAGDTLNAAERSAGIRSQRAAPG